MIKNMIGIICSLMIVACATREPKRMIVDTTNQLAPHVSEFFKYCKMYLDEEKCSPKILLRVKIKPLPSNVLGQCTTYTVPEYLRVVTIRPDVAVGYNMKVVLYHELFHCVLDKPHYDEELDIMNSYEDEKSTEFIYENWFNYLKAVFYRE